ncbi:CapA family protein [Psychrobacillus glaciei]|uniref:CapA family protein n=2 Tax=Psychrobacillus glaciei TaxID=2283160 RepID=A0A5J6SU02_9BACI|nr:CapA family protein [Psychrobacillus glaciei]
MIAREVLPMKSLYSLLISVVSVLLYSNLQVNEPFNEKFHGKQFSTFHMDYEEEIIEIGMIGDILLHYPLYNYESFLPSFEPIREELESLDILLANQESISAGTEFGYSGYPNFSSPKHIIGDLKTVGVDMISMANNHTLDQKEAGVLSAINHIKKYDIPYIGAYESWEDQKNDRILQVKDINFGFLGYTYGMNGYSTPNGKEYLVNQIDSERVSEEIRTLKRKVDFVIVSIHWGNEYELDPNDEQKQLALIMADAGADIIFGHHPHVIQPYEMITTNEGSETHVFYSVGNFFSGQTFDYTNIGGIAKVSIMKKMVNGNQATVIGPLSFYATAVLQGDPVSVYPLKDVETLMGQSDCWVQSHVFGK